MPKMTVEEHDELAVITCLFTPQPQERRLRNFELFRKQFSRTLHVAELSFDQRPWVTQEGPNVLHFRGGPEHVMWQKERLLNALIARLPSHVTHVAWVDADIIFRDPRWMTRALEGLKQFPVIQPFDTAVLLDAAGMPLAQGPSLIASAVEFGMAAFTQRLGTPGFAWAARREIVATLSLLDFVILGGGDAYMARAYSGVPPLRILAELTPGMQKAVADWAERARALTGGRVGYTPGTIAHLYHGSLESRRYFDRYKMMKNAAFDPTVDIALDASGLYAWNTPKAEFHAEVAAHFAHLAAAEND